jgi:hypothetical protein
METPIGKIWHLRKIEEDHYHVHCDEELDEKVNSVQFMGMLNGKHLSEVQIKELILFLDSQIVGYDMTINLPPLPDLSIAVPL